MTDMNLVYVLIGVTIFNVVMIFWLEYKVAKVNAQLITVQQLILVISKNMKDLNSARNIDNEIMKDMQQKVDTLSTQKQQK